MIELTIHPDGSLWEDDVKLAEAWQPTEADKVVIHEQAQKLADAIDEDLAKKLWAQFYKDR